MVFQAPRIKSRACWRCFETECEAANKLTVFRGCRVSGVSLRISLTDKFLFDLHSCLPSTLQNWRRDLRICTPWDTAQWAHRFRETNCMWIYSLFYEYREVPTYMSLQKEPTASFYCIFALTSFPYALTPSSSEILRAHSLLSLPTHYDSWEPVSKQRIPLRIFQVIPGSARCSIQSPGII